MSSPELVADRIRRRPIVADPELRRTAGGRPIVFEDFLTRQDIQRRPRRRWNARDDQGGFLPSAARRMSGRLER